MKERMIAFMRIRGMIKTGAAVFLIYGVLFLIVFFSKEISAGVASGIQSALGLVIPSLFFFMIASNLLSRSIAGELAAKPFAFLAKLFRIPPDAVLIVVLSLLGGYPVGAKLLADRVKEGSLSAADGERMLCYCVNCGPAFLISGVGGAIFGNLKAGVYLYLSQVAACLLTGCLCRRTSAGGQAVHKPSRRPPLSQLIVDSVTAAIRSMGTICGFVVAFSALLPFLPLLTSHLPAAATALLQGLLEVTAGCTLLPGGATPYPLLFAAGFTSFGGICVLFQITAMLQGSGIRIKRFFLLRPVYVLTSVLLTHAFCLLDPTALPAMAQQSGRRELFSVSPAAFAALLLLAVMLLFFHRKDAIIKP